MTRKFLSTIKVSYHFSLIRAFDEVLLRFLILKIEIRCRAGFACLETFTQTHTGEQTSPLHGYLRAVIIL